MEKPDSDAIFHNFSTFGSLKDVDGEGDSEFLNEEEEEEDAEDLSPSSVTWLWFLSADFLASGLRIVTSLSCRPNLEMISLKWLLGEGMGIGQEVVAW